MGMLDIRSQPGDAGGGLGALQRGGQIGKQSGYILHGPGDRAPKKGIQPGVQSVQRFPLGLQRGQGLRAVRLPPIQALGQGVYSMIGSFIRQLIVLLPAAWLLSLTGSLTNVWWSFPIAEISALLVAIFLLRRAYRKYIKPLPE